MKLNFMKKIAAVALAAATIMTCAPTAAYAEPADGSLPTIDSSKDVSLTITKYVGDNVGLDSSVTGKQSSENYGDTIEGVEFTLVKVADLDQDVTIGSQDVSLEYKLTANGAQIFNETGMTGKAAGDILTGTDLNKYIADKKATDYDTVLKAEGIKKVSDVTDEDGVVAFSSADGSENQLTEGQGLYLVVETFAPAQITKRSHPFFVSLPMTDKETEASWQYDVYAYPKNSTATTDIDKKITAVNSDENNGVADNNYSAEAQIGDVITYEVPVTALVPDGGLTKLGITDTMSKGLTFKKAADAVASTDVNVYSVDENDERTQIESSNYTVTLEPTADGSEANTLKVFFTKEYLDNVVNTGDKNPKFVFEYKAILNAEAILGTAGNKNDVYFTYNYNNGPAEDIDSEPKETKVYTWGINLTKKGEENKNLENVLFTLKKDGTDMTFMTRADGAYVPSSEEGADKTLTTNKEGNICIRGLESGTYTLTETKTNDGYVLLKSPVTIVITGDKTNGQAQITVDGKKVDLVNDGESSTHAFAPITVVNHKGFDLPATGGAGIAFFTIAGIVIAAVAGALLFMRRKTSK